MVRGVGGVGERNEELSINPPQKKQNRRLKCFPLRFSGSLTSCFLAELAQPCLPLSRCELSTWPWPWRPSPPLLTVTVTHHAIGGSRGLVPFAQFWVMSLHQLHLLHGPHSHLCSGHTSPTLVPPASVGGPWVTSVSASCPLSFSLPSSPCTKLLA